jgi:hypothetical protein
MTFAEAEQYLVATFHRLFAVHPSDSLLYGGLDSPPAKFTFVVVERQRRVLHSEDLQMNKPSVT